MFDWFVVLVVGEVGVVNYLVIVDIDVVVLVFIMVCYEVCVNGEYSIDSCEVL